MDGSAKNEKAVDSRQLFLFPEWEITQPSGLHNTILDNIVRTDTKVSPKKQDRETIRQAAYKKQMESYG